MKFWDDSLKEKWAARIRTQWGWEAEAFVEGLVAFLAEYLERPREAFRIDLALPWGKVFLPEEESSSGKALGVQFYFYPWNELFYLEGDFYERNYFWWRLPVPPSGFSPFPPGASKSLSNLEKGISFPEEEIQALEGKAEELWGRRLPPDAQVAFALEPGDPLHDTLWKGLRKLEEEHLRIFDRTRAYLANALSRKDLEIQRLVDAFRIWNEFLQGFFQSEDPPGAGFSALWVAWSKLGKEGFPWLRSYHFFLPREAPSKAIFYLYRWFDERGESRWKFRLNSLHFQGPAILMTFGGK